MLTFGDYHSHAQPTQTFIYLFDKIITIIQTVILIAYPKSNRNHGTSIDMIDFIAQNFFFLTVSPNKYFFLLQTYTK